MLPSALGGTVAIDKANDSITLDTDDKDAESKVTKNVADPVNNNDAVNNSLFQIYLRHTLQVLKQKQLTVAGVASTPTANLSDIQNAEEHAQEAKDYATKTDGEVQENGANTGNYSAKAQANHGTGNIDTGVIHNSGLQVHLLLMLQQKLTVQNIC